MKNSKNNQNKQLSDGYTEEEFDMKLNEMNKTLIIILFLLLTGFTYAQSGWVTAIVPDIPYKPIGKNNRGSFLEFNYSLSYQNGKNDTKKSRTYRYDVYNKTRNDFAKITIEQRQSSILITAYFKWNKKEPTTSFTINLSDFDYYGKDENGNRAYIYNNLKYLAVMYETKEESYSLAYYPLKLATGKTGFLYFDIAQDIRNLKIEGYQSSL